MSDLGAVVAFVIGCIAFGFAWTFVPYFPMAVLAIAIAVGLGVIGYLYDQRKLDLKAQYGSNYKQHTYHRRITNVLSGL